MSGAFRRYVADQLRTLKNWVHKANINYLKKRPDSTESILELPFHLVEAAEFKELVQELTPEFILKMLKRTQSLARVQATVEAGLSSAKRLERDGDMLRFGIEESLLLHFLSSAFGVAEAEALVSLGDYSAATALANAAILREDRLHILATIAKGKRTKGHAVEPELLNQIRVLLKQIDAKALGKRSIDIAAQLICVEPEMALDLVDQAKPSDIEKERAIERLSILTLEALGRERSLPTLDRIKARGFEGKIDLLQTSMAALSGKWSVSELIANIERIAKSKDKLFTLQSWIRVNRRAVRLPEVIRYALELAIRMTDYQLDATVLRRLADPLHSVPEFPGLRELVGMFDAQMAAAAKLGPSVDYVRLQIALARCEVQYDKVACENRLISLFYEIAQFPDVAVRAEASAWLLDGIAELESIAPYSAQFVVGSDTGAELDASFLALLDGTADHYRAASGVIKALTRRHFDKAIEFASMLNTQSRRDRALVDIVETLFEERGGTKCSAGPIRRTLSRIEERNIRNDALFDAIESFGERERDDVVIDDDLRDLLNDGCDIASAGSRCLASARAYVLVRHISKKEWSGLSARLLDCIEKAWELIDVAWLRVTLGFKIAQIVAPVSPELSALYLERTESVRARVGGLAGRNAEHAYTLCLRLALRAFGGLVPKRGYTAQDLESLALLIGGVPSGGERALLWADLALRCAIQGNNALCTELVNERLRPLLAAVPEGDAEYRDFVIIRCAPALYEASSAATMGMLQKLELPYRDEGYHGIARYLFRKQAPEEPEEYVTSAAYNIGYTRLLEVCEIASRLDSDELIYDLIEKVVDCLVSKTTDVPYNDAQREEVHRRLQEIVKCKLPASRHIRHEGYKVIARAQLARFRDDHDLEDLVASAERIPNISDRALVMFTTGLAVAKSARTVADRLLIDARKLLIRIPADWDRLERMVLFADEARSFNKLLSRNMLEEAIRLVPKTSQGQNRSLRNIVDLAHKIDPVFANDLIERLDDDSVRKRARREVELLELKKKVADEKPVFEELQIASPGEYRKLGAMLLGSLQSDRMDSIKPQAIRPCIQTVGRHPIREAYSVLAWIIQNAVEKHSTSDRAAYYLHPLFEATLAGAELAGQLADRSFKELRAVQEQHGARVAERGKDSEVYGREEAISFLKSWLEDKAHESLIICDAAFGPEDLVIVQMTRAINAICRIEVLTCRPKATPADGQMWEDVYRSQWRDLSEHSPPPTRITMISPVAAAECPIRSSWLISGDAGLELGGSIRRLGREDSFTFKCMDDQEVESLRQDVRTLLAGVAEWAGMKIRVSSFSL